MSKSIPRVGFILLSYEPEKETAELIMPVYGKLIKNFDNSEFKVFCNKKYALSENDAITQAKGLMEKEIDILVLMVGTWTNANYAIAIIKELKNIPFIIYAYSDLGPQMELKLGEPTFGFTGAIEIKNSIDQMGYKNKYYFLFGEPDGKEIISKIKSISFAASAIERLRKTRIGLIGYYTMGMYSATFDPISLKEKLGVTVEHIGENILINKIKEIDKKEANDVIKESIKQYKISDNNKITEKEIIANGKMYLAYKELLKDFDLDAFNTKCDPELGVHFGTCACLTHSILTDEGIICACEGDIHQTISMLILYYFSGKPTMFLDLVGVCRENNSLQFVSCGFTPMSIAKNPDDLRLCPQINMKGKGITQSYSLQPGEKVTIFRIDGSYPRGFYSGHIISGKSSKSNKIIKEWPSAEIVLDGENEWWNFAQNCTADHFALVLGDYSEELINFNKILNLETIKNI